MIVLLAGIIILLILVHPAPAEVMDLDNCTYYVATDGEDDNDGRSIETPWRTIAQANSTLQPGETVCIRRGTYDEEIRPAHSGTEGNYITYTNFNGEHVSIDRKSNEANNAVNISGRSYINISGLTLTNAKRLIEGWNEGFSHCIIQNNIMKNGGTGIRMRNGSNYNKILNNYIELQTLEEMEANIENDVLWMGDSSFNLIEGNEISFGGHKNIEMRYNSSYNIFRNNILHSAGDGHFNNTDGISRHIVFEGNTIIANILTPDSFGSGFSRNGNPHSIIRNNVICWVSGPFAHGIGFNQPYGQQPWSAGEHVRVYNNTIANNGYWYGIRIQYANEDLTWMHKDYKVKNNIIQKSNRYAIYENGYGTKPYDVIFFNNLIRGTANDQEVIYIQDYGSMTLSEAQSTWPTYFYDNIEADPMFVDDTGHDYHLEASSPCIDAGDFLTITVNSGSGTQIEVEDAYYFYDGFGIIEGDLIQLEGQTQTARIINIDYDNNILTMDMPLTWYNGQGISLPYNGSAPDIGAYEFVGITYEPEDLNHDSEVDFTDVQICVNAFLGVPNPHLKGDPDVNGDGDVDVMDVQTIANAILN